MHCGFNMALTTTFKVSRCFSSFVGQLTDSLVFVCICTERLLGYDEKPLRISQKLKEAKLNPMYVLKHVKDNKPFIPEMQKQQSEVNSNTNSGNNSPHNNYNNHRLVQKPSYDSSSSSATYSQWKHSNEKSDQHPKTAITSGRVGYEMIAPVMSSSVSSPTPSSFPQRGTVNTHSTGKTNDDDTNKNPAKEKDDYNNSSINAAALNQKPPDQYLSDLGLESGVASAIYSIMMEQQQDSKPM